MPANAYHKKTSGKARLHLDFAQQPKFVTLTRLIVSGVTFVIYFLAIDLCSSWAFI